MTSFVDHMKNITVPSMVQDINEMNHYWAMLTRIPGSGVSAQPNMDVVSTSHEEKLFPLDNGWYLRRETPVKGFTKKWPDPIHGPNELHIDDAHGGSQPWWNTTYQGFNFKSTD